MSALRSPTPMTAPTPVPILYGPDELPAQRLRTRAGLEVRWLDSRGHPAETLPEDTLILLDFSHPGAAEAARLARDLSGRALVAVGTTSGENAQGVIAALRAGVRDFIDLDASAADIALQLRRLHADIASPHVRSVAMTPPRGRVVVVLGVRAGLGTSTLVAHLGALAASALHMRPSPSGDLTALLIDLGQPVGDLGLYLDLRGDFGLEQALRGPERLDATLVRSAVPRHASGAGLLAPAQASAEGLDPLPLLVKLRALYPLTLVDLAGPSHRHWPTGLLREADAVWLLADPAVGSLVALDAALAALRATRGGDTGVGLVIARHDQDAGLPPPQIAARFGLPLLGVIPERLRTLRAASNLGQLLQDAYPRDPYLAALRLLLPHLHPFIAPPGNTGSGRLSRLLARLHAWTRR